MSRTTKIYVGNLPNDIREREIEDIFHKYGRIVEVDLKNRKNPPFAFIEFEDERDASKAVAGRDGYNFEGFVLRVEFPRGASSRGPPRGGGGGGGGRSGGAPFKRSDYRVLVSGLPPSGSWQDLKDHMREAGEVGYADVFRGGNGVVEFLHYDDMKYAIRKLDESKFRSHEGETSYIRVQEQKSQKSYSRDRSRSRSRPRSYSR